MGLYFFLLCLYRAWLRLDLFIFPLWIINFVDMLNIQMDWVSMRTEIRFFFQLSFSSMSSSHFGFWIVNYILLDSWCICFKNENIVEMSTKLLIKKKNWYKTEWTTTTKNSFYLKISCERCWPYIHIEP